MLDWDRKFNSQFWRVALKKFCTKLSMSNVEHMQIDGQIEWVDQILEDILQAMSLNKKLIVKSPYLQ